ncbi:MAG: hypothetical protein A3E83_08720 [Gammaproteobacteria bacterium RIFCSPHIGHO2_12_FULL_41_20]|nr:MAG: hypothetical protein A3E83_08720 [Gammaproteobacteria bacterium RIFCSPHIGHO2_12_FULL_41_20]
MLIKLIPMSFLLVFFYAHVEYGFAQPHFPSGTKNVMIAKVPGIRTHLLQNIAPIIEKSIAEGNYPGAIVLAGHHRKIIYRGIFGNERIVPTIAPMRFNTIFDIASLTKVVATTPAIMQLVEKAKLDLDAPVAQYWPTFGIHGKEAITIRELLTHMSGLPADITVTNKLTDKNKILRQIEQIKPHGTPGKYFLYSDINFIVLAHLIEIITKEDFDRYVKNHITRPLGMKNTFFLPAKKIRDRIAPTLIVNNKLRWGEVQDPLAYAMGGIAGNAGLFSNATDLAIYSQCLLDGGLLPRQSGYLLGPLTILKMTTRQTPTHITNMRGFGWDIDSVYSNRGIFFPLSSFGHTGWTGTSLWIDPTTQTWVIILTSRVHPIPAKHNQLIQDRRTIANIISASLTDIHTSQKNNTGPGELQRAYARRNISSK